MASTQKNKKEDAITAAIHAVTAETTGGQPPVDNNHVAEGAEKFSDETIAANQPKPTHSTGTVAAALGFKADVPVAARPKIKGQAWRLKPAGNLHNPPFDYTAQAGTEPVDLLRPEYWADMASQLRPFDEVHAICEDGSWRVDLQVIAVDTQWAKMYMLNQWDFARSYTDMPKTQEDEYDLRWTIMGKWAIYKKSMAGQPPIKDGFQTKYLAYEWLDGHLKTLNA